MRYRRADGFIVKNSGGYMTIYGQDTKAPAIIDPSVALVYNFIDGNLTNDQLFEALTAVIQNKTAFDLEQFDIALDKLKSLGLIERIFKATPSLPFLSVAYQGFWDSFDDVQNHFNISLLSYFTPVLVDPRYTHPDIIFINDSDAITGYDNSQDSAISVGVLTNKSDSGQNSYDFIINTFEEPGVNSAFHLPLWALYMSWDSSFADTISSGHFARFEKYNPTITGQAIYAFLEQYYKDESNVTTDNYWVRESHDSQKIDRHKEDEKGMLTIGMATYDDYDGVYFTIQAIRLYHPEILDRLRFLVVDNNPRGDVSDALRHLAEIIPHCKYVPFEEFQGTAIRDVFFKMATTEYVMSIDSHVMVHSGALSRMLDYLDVHPHSMDMYQGPLIHDDLAPSSYATSFRPSWSQGMYGAWHTDVIDESRIDEPFEILMQGLGLFVCRKMAWPGFNSRFRGFGGEEGYIHEKFRQRGHKIYCLPYLKWLHRFSRPKGTLYSNKWEDRIRNYLIGFEEIGWDTAPVAYHFSDLIGQQNYDSVRSLYDKEVSSPLLAFDAVYVATAYQGSKSQNGIKNPMNSIGLTHLARQYYFESESKANDTDYDIAHEEIIGQALLHDFRALLVIEDRAYMDQRLMDMIKEQISMITSDEWSSLHIGLDPNNNYQLYYHDSLFLSRLAKPPRCFISAYNLSYLQELMCHTPKKEDTAETTKS